MQLQNLKNPRQPKGKAEDFFCFPHQPTARCYPHDAPPSVGICLWQVMDALRRTAPTVFLLRAVECLFLVKHSFLFLNKHKFFTGCAINSGATGRGGCVARHFFLSLHRNSNRGGSRLLLFYLYTHSTHND